MTETPSVGATILKNIHKNNTDNELVLVVTLSSFMWTSIVTMNYRSQKNLCHY